MPAKNLRRVIFFFSFIIVDYDVMDMSRQMPANIVPMARMMVGTPVFAFVAFVPTIVFAAIPTVVPAAIMAAIALASAQVPSG